MMIALLAMIGTDLEYAATNLGKQAEICKVVGGVMTPPYSDI